MPNNIGYLDHTMIPAQGLRYKGMEIWDDRIVPKFEKHQNTLGTVGVDNITLDDIKKRAEAKNARGLSVDADGKFYAVKKPSQVEGLRNKIKVYAAVVFYAGTSNPKAALALLFSLTAALAAVAIYEGAENKKLRTY